LLIVLVFPVGTPCRNLALPVRALLLAGLLNFSNRGDTFGGLCRLALDVVAYGSAKGNV
jgi:hypothetical protein